MIEKPATNKLKVQTLAIETQELTKSYGGQVVIDGVNLAVPRGSIFGLIGPNGAGKTTTIRLLLGLAHPSAGRVVLLGEDVYKKAKSVLPRVGAIVDSASFYPYLSARRNLERFELITRSAAAHKLKPATLDLALKTVGLEHSAHKKIDHFSPGMKQRLAIAAALMRPRELLVLDEPFAYLDQNISNELRKVFRHANDNGTTIFFTNNNAQSVIDMCTHIGVMHDGQLVSQGSLAEVSSTNTARLQIETPDVESACEALLHVAGPNDISVKRRTNGIHLVDVEMKNVSPDHICAQLVHANVRVMSMTQTRSSLQDAFVQLTGGTSDVSE